MRCYALNMSEKFTYLFKTIVRGIGIQKYLSYETLFRFQFTKLNPA